MYLMCVLDFTQITYGEIRYKILAAKDIKDDTTPEKAAKIILDTVGLEADQFRLGHTKVLSIKIFSKLPN